LTVIQKGIPKLRNTDQVKIEIDMGTLDPAMLWMLYIYVVEPKPAAA
jgi:hypothetical protein